MQLNSPDAESWSNLTILKEQLKKEYDKWTSGNVYIDEIIQKSQFEAIDYLDILEWIDYNKLKNFKYLGFGEFYKAHWIDGCIHRSYSNGFKRYGNDEVGLQYINEENLQKVIFQLKNYLITDKSNIIRLYGLSLDPKRKEYVLVIRYEIFKFLDQHLEKTLDWNEKHYTIKKIVTKLKNLYDNNISINYFNPKNILLINRFGKIDVKFYIFGQEINIAYTSPEILREKKRKNDQSSDIFTLGMIFYRIIFEQEPFAGIKDESQITNEIINGVRPKFLHNVPYFLKELIFKCWNTNPCNRPTINELENILLQNSIYEFQYYNFSLDDKQELQNMSCVSERLYKNSLEYCAPSFLSYSELLLKSIKSVRSISYYALDDFINYNYINFYPVKGDKHIFKKFQTENEINNFNQDQIIDIQMFSDSYINNISSAKMESRNRDIKIIIKKLKNETQLSILQKQANKNEMSLILPYAREGNLRDYLKNQKRSLESKIEIATNIADGILYIHKDLDIIHENLHPKNILMFDGIAKISDLPLPYDKKKFSYYDKYLFENIGYIDPNLLLNENFKKDKSMDIYSLGTLLWEIMSEVVPYSKDRDEGILQLVLKIKNNGYREEDISSAPCEYINIYKKCWNGDSLARPKIEDVYEILLDKEASKFEAK
ncbi:kinase-like domain-containing protein [Glomus cerebriforme]|uniref:Kinase-like domain-containing protein n=1 Tax=Glomus cerebriforme TaxID=658196 RepID=A0A397SHV6_9GLOM|nr:kinase-like domain-containing protein [Glomus cerebriforme]